MKAPKTQENSIWKAFFGENAEENWIKSRDKSFNVVIVNKILKPHNVDENEEKISTRKGSKEEFYNLIFHDLWMTCEVRDWEFRGKFTWCEILMQWEVIDRPHAINICL